ncbi:hypothetical protein [Blastococcus sp. PRF04-17]|uniref:hypothetical protein n=1 Tax=Blastococcus sp. PRF04-17 TaxID=2933797 RepID=UPI001FF684D0|nr:hypothetical protein [Blastococcus sp. PRF04-17]UOY00496.1 hypothetical protein MVA48_16025 [Blastococcus sp. PRF04-17]
MSTPSEPEPPVDTGPSQSSTREIPVVKPTTGATAVQSLPPHPGATTPAPVPPAPGPMEAAQPTGPVDFVPGLPGVGTPPPPRTAAHATPPPPQPAPAPQHAPPAAAPPAAAPPAAAQEASPVWPDTLLDADEAATGRRRKERTPRERTPQDRAAVLGLGLVVLSLALLELGLIAGFGEDSYWRTVPLWSGFATVCVLVGVLVFAAFYRGGDRDRSGPAWRLAAGGLVGLAVFWLLVVLPVVASDRGFVLTASLAALGGALWIGPRRRS